jgi:hypothetical protein
MGFRRIRYGCGIPLGEEKDPLLVETSFYLTVRIITFLPSVLLEISRKPPERVFTTEECGVPSFLHDRFRAEPQEALITNSVGKTIL